MNKATLVIPTIFSIGIGLAVNFLILRRVLRKVNKPHDARQQKRLAAILAALLSVPSIIRIKQLEELGEAQPAKR